MNEEEADASFDVFVATCVVTVVPNGLWMSIPDWPREA